MSGVIRWNSLPAIEQETLNFPGTEWIRASDHDRIATHQKGQIDAFVRAEMVRAEYQGFTYGQALEEIANLKQTIARQATMIDRLKRMIHHYEDCTILNAYDDEEVECDCGMLKEVEAVEKG